MSLLDAVHERWVVGRRVRVLAERLAGIVPDGARVLDVGCGDGALAHQLLALRPDLEVRGIDLFIRPHTWIDVATFDGQTIPFDRGEFDVVMFIDVLHHTDDPMVLLAEAARVARCGLVIKDHVADGGVDRLTLRWMDRVGNLRHGVRLPYNYWSSERWARAFQALGLREVARFDALGLYPFPASLAFDRRLHFLSRLAPTTSAAADAPLRSVPDREKLLRSS